MSSLYNVVLGVIRMMRRRGFDVEQYAPLETYNEEQFNTIYREYVMSNNYFPLDRIRASKAEQKKEPSFRNLVSQYFKNSTTNESMVVYYADTENTVPQTEVVLLCETLLNSRPDGRPLTGAILVSAGNLTPAGKKSLYTAETTGDVFIQHFKDIDLLYDPTDSVWVPEVEVIAGQDSVKFLADENLKARNLPHIAMDDPIAKYLGMKIGDIAKFTRDNLLPGTLVDKEIFYRICYRRPPDKKRTVRKR